MKPIGITTTVPIEVLLAAGYRPVDLNNVFISDPDPDRLLRVAERAGFPQNCCTWIKGIYGVVMEQGFSTVLCVTTGDCSNTIMLMEVFRLKGINVVPFAYPDRPDPERMRQALESLARSLGTTLEGAEEVRQGLEKNRALARELDEMTRQDGLISGFENHYWLVSSSDFLADPPQYERQLEELLPQARQREPYPGDMVRLAYLGVPSVFGRDLYEFLERRGARVVFNEVQRQFSMPDPAPSLAEQYSRYTYPYSIFGRLEDILPQLRLRQVDGVIHYVQAFCHRGIGDIIFRHAIDRPLLTLEGNTEHTLSHPLKTRVEAFLETLGRRPALPGRAARPRS